MVGTGRVLAAVQTLLGPVTRSSWLAGHVISGILYHNNHIEGAIFVVQIVSHTVLPLWLVPRLNVSSLAVTDKSSQLSVMVGEQGRVLAKVQTPGS
jgi:hypothetical protein